MKTISSKFICAVLSAALFFSLPAKITAHGDELVYSYRDNEKMMIALTFDDGPHPRYTNEILDILKEYGVHATFFILGVNAVNYPETLRRCLIEGHEIANHTFSHTNLSNMSYGDICNEISKAEDIIYENLEIRPKLLRPPGGLYNMDVLRAASSLDYTVVLWNIDTMDWAHTSADIIAETVLKNIRPGDIILMHDYIGTDSPTPDALRLIIPKLIDKGYRFVTVSQLLGTS